MQEPDQQRVLNFASITLESGEAASHMINQARRIRITLNSRAASDYTSLIADRGKDDRGIGLKELAPLVGLELDMDRIVSPGGSVRRGEGAQKRKANRLVLAGVSEPIKEDVFEVEVKLERRQTGTPQDIRCEPACFPLTDQRCPLSFLANEIFRPPKRGRAPRAHDADTPGTSWQGYVPAYTHTELKDVLQRFKGFGGKIGAGS